MDYFGITEKFILAEIEKSKKEDQTFTKYLFKEYVENEEAWKSGLIDVICEYRNSAVRYIEVLTEAYSDPKSRSDDDGPPVIKFNQLQAGIMKSYLNLIKMNRLLLKHKYGINIEIQ